MHLFNTFMPIFGVLLPVVSLTILVLRVVLYLRARDGGGSSGNAGRHSGGGQVESEVVAAPDPRFAGDLRFTPDPRFAYQPDPRFGGVDTAYAPDDTALAPIDPASTPAPAAPGVASDGDLARIVGFSPPSASRDPFPTTSRALSLLGGQVLAALGLLIVVVSAKPTGHDHASHIANTSVGMLALGIMFVGFTFATVAASRVQRDLMGGIWGVFGITPMIGLYVISPAGISAAARRLSIPPVAVMLALYGLLAADVLGIAAHYFGH